MRRIPLLPALLAALTVAAAPAAAQDAPAYRVYDTRAGAGIGFATMVDALAAADVVFVGEQHGDPETHRLEHALLEALAERRPHVTLSLEMFERDVQPALDGYLAGTVEEEAFLSSARPWARYATDYRPLVETARARGWTVLAANVPRPLASAVARGGLPALLGLPPETRAHAAAEIACPRDEYHARFAATMASADGHGHGHGSGGEVPESVRDAIVWRYYEAQCLKDETMAESIVRARAADGTGALVVHYNGAFHSDHHAGTVARVARRDPSARLAVVTVVPVPDPAAADPAEHRGRADYVVFVPRAAEAGPDPAPGADAGR